MGYICTVDFWNKRMKSCHLQPQLAVIMLSKISHRKDKYHTITFYKLLFSYRDGSWLRAYSVLTEDLHLILSTHRAAQNYLLLHFQRIQCSLASKGCCGHVILCMNSQKGMHTHENKRIFLVSDLGKMVWACNSTTWELERGRRMGHQRPA